MAQPMAMQVERLGVTLPLSWIICLCVTIELLYKPLCWGVPVY